MPSNLTDLIKPSADALAEWLEKQRNVFREESKSFPAALSSAEAETIRKYFDPTTIDKVRWKTVSEFPTPSFLADLDIAEDKRFNVKRIVGLTFDDTILLSDELTGRNRLSFLFHEFVHAVQFDALGIKLFALRYVEGWIKNGLKYRAIPLEQSAYGLQASFDSGSLFSVEKVIGDNPGGVRET